MKRMNKNRKHSRPMTRYELLKTIRQTFNDNDIRDICFELNVDYESLPASGKGGKIRELVEHIHRRGRTGELLSICQRHRPYIPWSRLFETLPPNPQSHEQMPVTTLFLAANPTDVTRLRLDEEIREIREKIRLARLREQFDLHLRMAVRPEDISQALLDVQPQIVHFSGHGYPSGALCFEDQDGRAYPIQPDALATLFEQFASIVHCVVLNACYSDIQAKAIAKHIEYVIGMDKEISDVAAIAFAIGFYQALGAGRTIEDAYRLGCVQIKLQDIPEHLTPVLVQRGQA